MGSDPKTEAGAVSFDGMDAIEATAAGETAEARMERLSVMLPVGYRTPAERPGGWSRWAPIVTARDAIAELRAARDTALSFAGSEGLRADALAARLVSPADREGHYRAALERARFEIMQDIDPDAVLVGIDDALANAPAPPGREGQVTAIEEAIVRDRLNGAHVSYEPEAQAERLYDACLRLVQREDAPLDAAYSEVVALLPKGWALTLDRNEDAEYIAQTWRSDGHLYETTGDTPAAALQAMTVTLRELAG